MHLTDNHSTFRLLHGAEELFGDIVTDREHTASQDVEIHSAARIFVLIS